MTCYKKCGIGEAISASKKDLDLGGRRRGGEKGDWKTVRISGEYLATPLPYPPPPGKAHQRFFCRGPPLEEQYISNLPGTSAYRFQEAKPPIKEMDKYNLDLLAGTPCSFFFE